MLAPLNSKSPDPVWEVPPLTCGKSSEKGRKRVVKEFREHPMTNERTNRAVLSKLRPLTSQNSAEGRLTRSL